MKIKNQIEKDELNKNESLDDTFRFTDFRKRSDRMRQQGVNVAKDPFAPLEGDDSWGFEEARKSGEWLGLPIKKIFIVVMILLVVFSVVYYVQGRCMEMNGNNINLCD